MVASIGCPLSSAVSFSGKPVLSHTHLARGLLAIPKSSGPYINDIVDDALSGMPSEAVEDRAHAVIFSYSALPDRRAIRTALDVVLRPPEGYNYRVTFDNDFS